MTISNNVDENAIDDEVIIQSAGYGTVPAPIVLGDFTANAVRVYALLQYRSGGKPTSWYCYKNLADDARMSTSTLRRALSELKAAGYLVVSKRFRDDGSQSSNSYKLLAVPLSTYEQGGAITSDQPDYRPRPAKEVTKPKQLKEQPMGLFSSLEAAFEVGWRNYPRKTDKGDAFKKFKETVETHGVDPEKLAATMGRYATACQNANPPTPKEFIKHGKTFFGPKLSWQEFMDDPNDKREVQSDGYYELDGEFFDPDGEPMDENAWDLARSRIAMRALNA